MKLTEYAKQHETAAEVIEKSQSIEGQEVVERLKESTKSVRRGVALAIQHAGYNPDGHAKTEELDGDTTGDCHMGNKRVRIDLDKSGENADHVILHEYLHLQNARKNSGVRVTNTKLEEGITDSKAEAVTGKDFTYSDEKQLAADVADANEDVALSDLHEAYQKGENERINTWYMMYLMKKAA